MIAAPEREVCKGGGRSWSTSATKKIVSRAATDERTGDVREIRTRNDPEKTTELSVSKIEP